LSYEPSNFLGKIAGKIFKQKKVKVEQAAWIFFNVL